MANLPETPAWPEGIYQIETTDRVIGGPDGKINAVTKQLADRTAYLKGASKAAADAAAAADGKADQALQQMAAIEVAAGSAQENAALALQHQEGAQAALALAVQARSGADAAALQSSDNARLSGQAAGQADAAAREAQAASSAAVQAASLAVDKVGEASTSATNAAGSANTATTKAGEAAASASAAATSASNAATSEANTTNAITNRLSSATPLMDGVAAAGNATDLARGNHRHPTDTSRAPVESPTFTGTPSGPTAALGTNTKQLANTEFVQSTTGGVLNKSVAGGSNVTLTVAETGNAVLNLTGALTANIAVIVPTSPTNTWVVKNATTGAFTLTVRTASGTGVAVTQGDTAILFTDGTNVLAAYSDVLGSLRARDGAGSGLDADLLDGQHASHFAPLASPNLTGEPTAPTAAPGTNTKQIANTEFVLNEKPQAATVAEMQAGTQTAIRSMSPANIKQAIDKLASGGAAFQRITASMTVTVPEGMTGARLFGCAGGGGGGYNTTAGSAGGSTSFGTYATATGGGGGGGGAIGAGGAGGAGDFAGGSGGGGSVYGSHGIWGDGGKSSGSIASAGGGGGGSIGQGGAGAYGTGGKATAGRKGGGGGGGLPVSDGSGGNRSPGGGGGGGVIDTHVTGLTPGQQIVVTIGAGGAGAHSTAGGGGGGYLDVLWTA